MSFLIFGARDQCLRAAEPVRIILDTDIASDCDDAGAVALLNALADNGEADILAMMVSTGGEWGAPALCAINTWYGRGDVPLGTLKNPKFWTGGSPQAPAGAHNYLSYSHHLAHHFPTRLKSGDGAPDARVLYRKILAAQPDASVVINTIGPLINLAALLDSPPDEHSPLNGIELARAKVRLLVVAGGKNPAGSSSNFSKADAGVYARQVIEQWPTPVVFVGNEVGGTVLTGWTRNSEATGDHPARAAYRRFHGGNEAKKRPSWDQAGVLFAVRGKGDLFELVDDGHLSCTDDGRTVWVPEPASGRRHAYVRKRGDIDGQLAEIFEVLMTQPARRSPSRQGGAMPDEAD